MDARAVGVGAYFQYGSANDRTLLRYLVKSHVWDLLYFDHAACIFVHQSSWQITRGQGIGGLQARARDGHERRAGVRARAGR